jgi:hypothetical protein
VAEELSIPSRGYSEAHFTGLRVTGHLAPKYSIPGCESAGSNPRTPLTLLLRIIKYKNAPLGDEPGGALCLMFTIQLALTAAGHEVRFIAMPALSADAAEDLQKRLDSVPSPKVSGPVKLDFILSVWSVAHKQ